MKVLCLERNLACALSADVKLFSGSGRCDHFSLRGKYPEPYICGHDCPQGRPDVYVGCPAAENMHESPSENSNHE